MVKQITPYRILKQNDDENDPGVMLSMGSFPSLDAAEAAIPTMPAGSYSVVRVLRSGLLVSRETVEVVRVNGLKPPATKPAATTATKKPRKPRAPKPAAVALETEA